MSELFKRRMTTDYSALLKDQFNSQVQVREESYGVAELILPAWHDDGDMVRVFLEPVFADGEEWVHISDHALTLMHVFDVDVETTEGKTLFLSVVRRSMINEANGILFLDVKAEKLLDGVLHFIQAATRIHEMGRLKG